MIFITINSKDGDVKELNSFIEQGKQIFILFYMEGCGPCNATRPEWKKIENILKKKYNQNQNIVIAEVDQALISKIPLLKKQPSGFPTMFYITNNGNLLEDYEESDILLKDRSIDSFIDWIESKIKIPLNVKGGSRRKKKYSLKNKKSKRGCKWSLKYKKSINCFKPKGFSQKQYCKYSRKR